MNPAKYRALGATFFAIALGVTASHANAQQGKFILPVPAHLGTHLLTPGEYTVSVRRADSWPQVVEISRGVKVVSVLATTEGAQPQFGKSYLRLVTVGTATFISEFSSGATGKLFTFAMPKAVHEEAAIEAKSGKTGLVAVTGGE